jgi:cytochrome c oxidase cbb3-type subunit III
MRRKLAFSVKQFRATSAVTQAKQPCRSAEVWIAAVLVIGAGMQGHVAAQEKGEPGVSSASSTDISGARTFRAQCAPCHGLDGRGGEHAPSIVRDQVKSMSDEDLAQVIRHGIPDKGMPEFSSLSPTSIKAVIAYLRTMQGVSAPQTVSGDPAHGRSLFFGKAACSSCHVMEGAGNFIADDLSDFGGDHQPSEIRKAILKPEKVVDSPREQATITTRSGRELSGIVRNEDNFSLQLQDARGEFYLIAKADAMRISRAPLPEMPADYSKRLTTQEIDDLVIYIAKRTTK